jgi:farnesyl diphosphate synthase
MNLPAGSFQSQLTAVAADTERLLTELLAAKPVDGELARPNRLLDAMRYATLNGGKRFRPFLVAASASLFDVSRQRALLVGAALECVHCYSLVHDDLPAMDDDDLRRGQPTAHKKYDEATAILAGDGLLTFAFDILARDEVHPDPAVRGELVLALARGAGLGGMVGGQMLDLAAEGRFDNGRRQSLNEQGVATLQAMKTGALLRFGCIAGGILGQARAYERAALDRYGDIVGKAFQIADDLLDVEGDSATLGKAAGKDAEAGKATLVAVLGIEKAKARLKSLVGEAETALKPFGNRAAVLAEAARFVAERKA